MEFFRVNQRALQLYDVNHARQAGNAYKVHQMNLDDWQKNTESVAVLQPIADWTQHMRGTKYPTPPLVLPTLYGLIDSLSPSMPLHLSFPCMAAYELEPEAMDTGVREARTTMWDDMVRRWITQLPLETKRTYAIATLLHPCFKKYDFIDAYPSLVQSSEKQWAIRELRTEWLTVWKPQAQAVQQGAGPSTSLVVAPALLNENEPASTELAAGQAATKKRKASLGSLLSGGKARAPTPAVTSAVADELDQYLNDPEEPDVEACLLAWWKVKELKWPALAKMAKQYLCAPCSSAGVERVFSAAGKMHDDLKKSAKDSTLEHSLFAAFNTE